MKINIIFLFLLLSFSGYIFPQVVINDEYFQNQWYLNMPGNENTRADIRVLDAWAITMGNSNQKIADIEDDNGGVPDLEHEDLIDRITTQGLGVTGEHSTNVAGLIVANHNTIGIAGMNKYAQLYSYVYSSNNQWADKIQDARLDGNQIINISQGTYTPLPGVYTKLAEAYSSNIITVVSVGNNTSNITYPAVYQGVIAVGSSTKANTSSSWSDSGPQIEFLAPGGIDFTQNNPQNIFTTSDNGGYVYAEGGTSLAAPLVSGAASLLLAYKPDLTNEDIKNILIYSCDKLQEMNGNNFTNKCGYGRINLKKAMQFLESPYTLVHGTATLTKLEDNVTWIFTGNPVLANGTYYVDFYKLSVDKNDLNYQVSPIAWLPKGYSGANPNNCQEFLSVSTTSTSLHAYTFFYYVRTNYGGDPINMWFPYNPSPYYTILGKPNQNPISRLTTNPFLNREHYFFQYEPKVLFYINSEVVNKEKVNKTNSPITPQNKLFTTPKHEAYRVEIKKEENNK
jgi:Subtilase family